MNSVVHSIFSIQQYVGSVEANIKKWWTKVGNDLSEIGTALYQGWRNIASITYVGLLKMSFSKSAKMFCFQLLANCSAVLTKQILKTPFILSGC